MPPTETAPEPAPQVYADALARLFDRQPTRMVPDLDRIRTLVELLGRPDQAYPAIQVTGTNGKTTTTHMVACLLGALGLTAGSYTSPHLQDVRERIRVATEPMSRAAVVEGLDYLEPFLAEVDQRHPERATFFEVLTALAFNHFADAPVDVGVFEVGMGGRWDATNLVRGEVALINRVALDHPELGSAVEQVAEEKAGIIKEGAAVVSAAQEPAVRELLGRIAAEKGGRIVVAGEDFDVVERVRAVGGQLLTLRGVTGEVEDVYLPLHGAHQARNAAAALAAVEAFLGFAGGLDAEVVRTGFAAVRSPGRLEVVRRGGAAEDPASAVAPVVLDGAHNPAGMRALATALTEEFAYRNRVVVLGILGDKDVEAMVGELVGVADHLVLAPAPSSRAADVDRLAAAADAAGLSAEQAEDVGTALELATGLATGEDAVVVTGSLYTVGAAREHLGLEPA
jgi:dihydrofolate synthase / folylpolyglutamate synthase